MSKEKMEQIIDEVYEKYADSHFIPPSNPKGKLLSDQLFRVIPMEHSKESFINKCKIDSKFSKKWGLKIKERELSLEERVKLYGVEKINTTDAGYYEHSFAQFEVDEANIPTKVLTLTYQNEKIESYE